VAYSKLSLSCSSFGNYFVWLHVTVSKRCFFPRYGFCCSKVIFTTTKLSSLGQGKLSSVIIVLLGGGGKFNWNFPFFALSFKLDLHSFSSTRTYFVDCFISTSWSLRLVPRIQTGLNFWDKSLRLVPQDASPELFVGQVPATSPFV